MGPRGRGRLTELEEVSCFYARCTLRFSFVQTFRANFTGILRQSEEEWRMCVFMAYGTRSRRDEAREGGCDVTLTRGGEGRKEGRNSWETKSCHLTYLLPHRFREYAPCFLQVYPADLGTERENEFSSPSHVFCRQKFRTALSPMRFIYRFSSCYHYEKGDSFQLLPTVALL